MKICQNCVIQLTPNFNFCPFCGHPLKTIKNFKQGQKGPGVQGAKIKKGCAYCNQTGHNILGGVCPVCKGKRYNIISSNYQHCNDCNGTGHYLLGGPCPECKGTGYL